MNARRRPHPFPGFLTLTVLLATLPVLRAADAADAGVLPAPTKVGGKPLMQALADRHTTRDFKPEFLDARRMSDLLWAAFGVNRPENAHRTAPSAKNSQEIDLYVATANGVFLYEAGPHRLRPVSTEDIRGLTSGQDFAKVAPVTLIYVADLTRLKDTPEDQARVYAAFDAGCICQNVYLYCASAGLGTVVHDLERAPLGAKLGLRAGQHIVMAQAVGIPK
jgi:nitroreductase